MNKSTPPGKRYLINPVAVGPALWFPQAFQLFPGQRRASYLNSLWLGTVYNLMILPYRFTCECLRNLFHFRLVRLLQALWVLPLSVLLFAFYGILGQLAAVDITIEQLADSKIASDADGELMLALGNKCVVTDIAAEIVKAQVALAELLSAEI